MTEYKPLLFNAGCVCRLSVILSVRLPILSRKTPFLTKVMVGAGTPVASHANSSTSNSIAKCIDCAALTDGVTAVGNRYEPTLT